MIEGSLRNMPLVDVFQIIATSQKKGTLLIERGRSEASVRFDRGQVRAASLTPGIDLAEVLVRMELLPVRSVLSHIAALAQKATGARVGVRALRKGELDEDGLRSALEHHVTEVLAELLTWRSGSFTFGEDDRESSVDRLGGFDAMLLLMGASEQLGFSGESSFDGTAVFRRVGDPTKVEVPASAWDVLALVDGRRTGESIAAEVDLPERKVFLVLHELEETGVIEPSPFRPEEPQVLVLGSGNSYTRLLRLLLLRCRVRPFLASDSEAALAFAAEQRPRALVVDEGGGTAWELVRELRKLRGLTHLPALVLSSPDSDGGVLTRMRRPKALTLEVPFGEHEFKQLLSRMVGAPAV